MTLRLYSAWRATAPYRVRIGLALKGLAYDYTGIDLLAGQQRSPEYRAVNPAHDHLASANIRTQLGTHRAIRKRVWTDLISRATDRSCC